MPAQNDQDDVDLDRPDHAGDADRAGVTDGDLDSSGADESADDESADEAAAGAAAAAAGDGELVVTLGDDADADVDIENNPDAQPEQRNGLIRELRTKLKLQSSEAKRLNRELQEARGASAGQPAAIVVGDKPTMEGCDFDAEKFEAALESWHTRKRDSDEQQRQREAAETQQRTQWQTRIDAVKTAAGGLKVRDYDDAAATFEDSFSMIQQGIIIGGPDDPKASALLRYALGKNPKKAAELAAIKDPVKFTWAVAELNLKLKVSNTKGAPPPDRAIRSSVAGAAAVDNQLVRLEAEADRTGDRSKVAAYRRTLREKQRQPA